MATLLLVSLHLLVPHTSSIRIWMLIRSELEASWMEHPNKGSFGLWMPTDNPTKSIFHSLKKSSYQIPQRPQRWRSSRKRTQSKEPTHFQHQMMNTHLHASVLIEHKIQVQYSIGRQTLSWNKISKVKKKAHGRYTIFLLMVFMTA